MNPLDNLAVIIPVGPKESAWLTLLPDLACLPDAAEIIVVGTIPKPNSFAAAVDRFHAGRSIRWLVSPAGRAQQLNRGAQATEKKYLWFLHADSRVEKAAIEALSISLSQSDEALHYFDLRFLDDGPELIRINNIGVWIRSHWMGLPFGDQGFCIRRSLFERLGAFNEKALYGEDHLLVWAARQSSVPLKCTGAAIRTSARRYQQRGWTKTTAETMILTTQQALPELVKFLRKRATHAKL